MTANRTALDKTLAFAVLLALIGIEQFIYCTSRAMSIYPGGTSVRGSFASGGPLQQAVQQVSNKYDWTRNWLSDLGCGKYD